MENIYRWIDHLSYRDNGYIEYNNLDSIWTSKTRFHLSQWTKASRSPPWDAHISVTFRPQSSPSDPARAPTCHATWSSTCPGSPRIRIPEQKEDRSYHGFKKRIQHGTCVLHIVDVIFYLYGCVYIYTYRYISYFCVCLQVQHNHCFNIVYV